MGRRTPVYLIEKVTGLRDENGVELFYAVAARLTREAADTEFETEIKANAVRVRKIIASK